MSPETLITASKAYREIATGRTDIEIWDDAGYGDEEGRAYFSIVARTEGIVRKLKYLRVANGRIEERQYDENGDDSWVFVD